MPSSTCPRCRFKQNWIGFHVCFDASKPEPHQSKFRQAIKGRWTEAQKAAFAQIQNERWEQFNEENKDRDAEIVRLYNTGEYGYRGLSEKFSIAHTTVRRVLQRAQDAGQTVIRKRGLNLNKTAQTN